MYMYMSVPDINMYVYLWVYEQISYMYLHCSYLFFLQVTTAGPTMEGPYRTFQRRMSGEVEKEEQREEEEN